MVKSEFDVVPANTEAFANGRLNKSAFSAQDAAGGKIDMATLLIVIAFFLIGLIGLGDPTNYYFDEGFYVPAAVRLGQGLDVVNREHPMLAKEMLATWFQLFGVGSASWRMPSLLCGAIAIYAAAMSVEDRRSRRLLAALLALCGLSFAISRVTLLEPYYLMFSALAVWAFTRGRYYTSGICFGLAIACKWSAAPLLVCFVAGYAVIHRDRLVRGAIAFGLLPAAIYLMTFLPALWLKNGLSLREILPLQWAMVNWHQFIGPSHPNSSHAWQWAIGAGAFWALEPPKGILIAGNPVVMLALLPAIAWGLWKRWPEAYIYVTIMMFWELTPKHNQYLYHYMLPAAFGLSALARIASTNRRFSITLITLSMISFALMYPAYTRHPLSLHTRIWPYREVRKKDFNQLEKADFARRDNCLYHLDQCGD